ncbi:GerMN domain-containing protein [Kribbella sp. CA-247076]|uniref:GerMN domain-containing protein n=1 Tax=Kribbella sp. CA-247076 TaxID=3239941 RepID=UPI003D8CBB80
MKLGQLCVAVGLSASLVACGVRPQEHPQPVDGIGSPPVSATPSSGGQTEAALSNGVIYLLRADRLTAVRRNGRTLQDQLAALLAGPTDPEQEAGLRSALPSTGGAGSVRTEGTVAVVDVPGEFKALEGTEQVLGVAQLVYTLTDGSGRHTAVRLRHDGMDLAAPTATGQLVNRPVGRADYASFAPR